MADMKTGSVDLIVTSPPYLNVKRYNDDANQAGNIGSFPNYIQQLLRVWNECGRVLKPNGKIAINTPIMPMPKKTVDTHHNRHTYNIDSAIHQSILEQTSLFFLDTFIWRRTNGQGQLMFGSYPYPGNLYSQNTVEFISIYVKAGKPMKRARHIKESSRLTQKEWVDLTRQVWDIPIPDKSSNAYGQHPALMPVEIAIRCIRLYTFVGDVVLDPFCGSGTTCLAAARLGRDCIGIDISAEYCGIARRRLAAVQTTLDRHT